MGYKEIPDGAAEQQSTLMSDNITDESSRDSSISENSGLNTTTEIQGSLSEFETNAAITDSDGEVKIRRSSHAKSNN